MFNVYENGIPAKNIPEVRKLHESWNNHSFNTFEEAREYAFNYFYPFVQEFHGCGIIEFNEGCFAEIREE